MKEINELLKDQRDNYGFENEPEKYANSRVRAFERGYYMGEGYFAEWCAENLYMFNFKDKTWRKFKTKERYTTEHLLEKYKIS